jgi:hypothetical protein
VHTKKIGFSNPPIYVRLSPTDKATLSPDSAISRFVKWPLTDKSVEVPELKEREKWLIKVFNTFKRVLLYKLYQSLSYFFYLIVHSIKLWN